VSRRRHDPRAKPEFDGHDDLHQAGSPGSMSKRIYGDDPWA
jgi:hypothetical protein